MITKFPYIKKNTNAQKSVSIDLFQNYNEK